jgi:hypothetical protein
LELSVGHENKRNIDFTTRKPEVLFRNWELGGRRENLRKIEFRTHKINFLDAWGLVIRRQNTRIFGVVTRKVAVLSGSLRLQTFAGVEYRSTFSWPLH